MSVAAVAASRRQDAGARANAKAATQRDRDDEWDPSEQVERRGSGRAPRWPPPTRWRRGRIDERDAEVGCSSLSRAADESAGPDVVDHRQERGRRHRPTPAVPTIGTSRTTIGECARQDQEPDPLSATTRKILTSLPSNAGSAGRNDGCAPSESTPARPVPQVERIRLVITRAEDHDPPNVVGVDDLPITRTGRTVRPIPRFPVSG